MDLIFCQISTYIKNLNFKTFFKKGKTFHLLNITSKNNDDFNELLTGIIRSLWKFLTSLTKHKHKSYVYLLPYNLALPHYPWIVIMEHLHQHRGIKDKVAGVQDLFYETDKHILDTISITALNWGFFSSTSGTLFVYEHTCSWQWQNFCSPPHCRCVIQEK
jgi:hypothetical protein